VINVVSTSALYTRKMISVYAASKWVIRGFTGCPEVECALIAPAKIWKA